jgi:hypothetical protein
VVTDDQGVITSFAVLQEIPAGSPATLQGSQSAFPSSHYSSC